MNKVCGAIYCRICKTCMYPPRKRKNWMPDNDTALTCEVCDGTNPYPDGSPLWTSREDGLPEGKPKDRFLCVVKRDTEKFYIEVRKLQWMRNVTEAKFIGNTFFYWMPLPSVPKNIP